VPQQPELCINNAIAEQPKSQKQQANVEAHTQDTGFCHRHVAYFSGQVQHATIARRLANNKL